MSKQSSNEGIADAVSTADQERQSIDSAANADKLSNGHGKRSYERAMRLQLADKRPLLASGVWA